MKNGENNSELVSDIAYLAGGDRSELTPAQCCPDLLPGEPCAHEHEWPQETVPYPIAHAMEFCFENCRIAQRSKEPIGVADLGQQRCRFPLHCSIVPREDER